MRVYRAVELSAAQSRRAAPRAHTNVADAAGSRLLIHPFQNSTCVDNLRVRNGAIVTLRYATDRFSWIDYRGLQGWVETKHLSRATGQVYRGPHDMETKQTKPQARTLLALTYNLSWAVAQNKIAGSEAQFVKDRCFEQQESQNGFCRTNAIASLHNMQRRADVIAFQEYMPWDRVLNSNLVIEEGPFIENGALSGEGHLVAPNVPLKNIMPEDAEIVGYIAGIQGRGFFASLCTCWDVKKLGAKKRHECVSLSQRANDLRPCYVAFTEKRFLLINMQAPQPHVREIFDAMGRVEECCRKVTNKEAVKEIVLLGDFNDGTGEFIQKNVSLVGRTLGAPSKLRTCCYDPETGMREDAYQLTGDYAMSTMQTLHTNRVLFDGSLNHKDAVIPAENEGRSDHDPVVAEFLFTHD